jgi:hypothetical protein
MKILTCVLLTLTSAFAQHSTMPAGMSHEEHLKTSGDQAIGPSGHQANEPAKQIEKDEALKARGAVAMGFDQDAVTHHFLIGASGGAIVVSSKDSKNTGAVAAIRAHLKQIAEQFAHGEFDKPFATHGEPPPGSAAMAAKKKLIDYRYEERSGGGSVVITTGDATARNAIHEFLRYQIVEHKTGDPLTALR